MNHMFDAEIAAKYGLHAAILLENIRFWIEKNRCNGRHYHDGRYWTYSSAKAFTEFFPYLTERQVRYALKQIEEDGLVITGNFNSSTYDRTVWYALTDKGEAFLKGETIITNLSDASDNGVKWNLQPCQMEVTTMSNGSDTSVTPIPSEQQIKHTAEQQIESEADKPPKPAAKRRATPAQRYGQYGNVKLTEEELAQLKARYPTQWQERIDRLSEYIASRGDKYKSHYATILSWARRDEQEGRGKGGKPIAPAPAKVNPAQQYVQRQYDNDALKRRLAVDLSIFGEEGG